jgi:DNA-binding response OmpR family regulator
MDLSMMKQNKERSIIVIDDNASLRTELGRMLEDGGWKVVLCEDGSSAIRSVTAGSYDAVLVDFSLPDIRGHVVTETLRMIMPRACIIGMSFQDREKEFLAAGADSFFLKPFDIGEVNRIAGMSGSRTRDTA